MRVRAESQFEKDREAFQIYDLPLCCQDYGCTQKACQLAPGPLGLSNGIMYDVSVRYGYDEISYALNNTFNPSMGDTSSQKNFHPGDLSNTELQIQADFSM